MEQINLPAFLGRMRREVFDQLHALPSANAKADALTTRAGIRDLARNEEFSEIAVINIFFSSQNKNTVICWGGVMRGKFRDKSRN